ncbi:heterokaryon incompatibility protein-domain-containing protein [Nemania abortiva]|nr:heterokaryon incompatibility protein-domain-containing protein [Nemania abortiva]
MSLRLDSRISRDLYPQLDPGTIRLIELSPGDFSALPIHCHLVEKDLATSPSYKALSYSWRNSNDGSPDEAIVCNSQLIYVSANLHAALRRLRMPNAVVSIWVDAICINQQDYVERTYQVSMMRDIYQNSSEVLICLGESGPDDHMGDWIWENADGADGDDVLLRDAHDNPNIVQWFGDRRDIPKLKAYFASVLGEERASRFGDKKFDIFGAFCVLHLLASGVPVDKIWHLRHVSCSTGIVDGLNAIMGKAWWKRIWVVQETVVAKKPVVYYGNLCAPWRMFALAAVEYDTSRVRDKFNSVLSHLNSGHSLMQFTRVIMEIESTRRAWERREPLVPLTVLRKFRSRLATDPRDKVFAVLGLIRSWGKEKSGQAIKGITPDYTAQDHHIFLEATILLIRNTRSLAALTGTLQGTTSQSLMPSWVTDWNCPPSVNEHIRLSNIQLYDAGQYLSGSVALHGQSILETQGCLVDEIEYVGRTLENEQGRSRARLTVVEWQSSLHTPWGVDAGEYAGGGSLYTAFWRTLCADLGFVQYGYLSDYVREFRRLPEETSADEAYERWLTVDAQSNRRTSLVGGIWVEPTNSEIETESKNTFQYLLECASGGRRFFKTKKGYIGTGPFDMEVGDPVAVLLGSRVPFIIRRDDQGPRRCSGQDIQVLFSESASYKAGRDAKVLSDETINCHALHQHCHRVVGDAYVHGIMTAVFERTNQWKVEPIFLV